MKSYHKVPRGTYERKPYGWVLGYQCRGKYRVWGATGSRYIPKSAEFIDLVVPKQQDATLPLGVEVLREVPGPGMEKRLIVKVARKDLDKFKVAEPH